MDTFRSWMWIVEEKISALSAMIPLSTGISHPSSRLASGRTRRDSLFIFLFFWRDRVCWPLLCFAYGAHFVWIRTQRAAVASRCATNLATHLPFTRRDSYCRVQNIFSSAVFCMRLVFNVNPDPDFLGLGGPRPPKT